MYCPTDSDRGALGSRPRSASLADRITLLAGICVDGPVPVGT